MTKNHMNNLKKTTLVYCATIPAILLLASGCEFDSTSNNETVPVNEANNEEAQRLAETGSAIDASPIVNNTGVSIDLASDLSNARFLHENVSQWPITSTLRTVSVSGDSVLLDYDKAGEWPPGRVGQDDLAANPWIFVKQDGQWYAATWEWMRPGQTVKGRASVNGDHIKREPLGNFVPRSGEVYGFMVSGLARGAERNVKERTNVVFIQWP
jgi:hypothetical protein